MVMSRKSQSVADTAAAVMVRLHKGISITENNLAFVSFADVWNPLDAEEEFAWQRLYDVGGINSGTLAVDYEQHVGVGGNPPARGDHPYWSEIDIKVKRTVRPPEILGLTFGAKGRAGDILRVWAWLRALVAV